MSSASGHSNVENLRSRPSTARRLVAMPTVALRRFREVDHMSNPVAARSSLRSRGALTLIAAATIAIVTIVPSVAQQNPSGERTSSRQKAEHSEKADKKKNHKLAIQVADERPETMNLALNNARNVVEYYKSRGEAVQIEIVTYGPGLHMLREDTSPVKQRIAAMALEEPAITFAACANTQANMSKREDKTVPLVSEAKVVPSGVVRLMELQRQGWAYIRP